MKHLLTMLIVFVVAAPAFSVQDPGNAPQQSKDLPAIRLQDFEGKSFDADSLKGSIIVLDFWATWCGPCIREIPEYNKLQEKYAAKGVKIVGVTMASGEAAEVKPFVKKHNMKYTVLMGDDAQAGDFNVVGFPLTFLVTRDWKLYRRYLGGGPAKLEKLAADIDAILAGEKEKAAAAGN